MNDMMNSTALAVGAGVIMVILVVVSGIFARRGRKLNAAYYEKKWNELQKLLKDTATWPLAIIDADKLLDQALKDRRFKGKTMGERLVAAQREIKYNDEVWFGHKLRNKLVHESDIKLRERDVKDALLGIKAALKDLGAL
ncbi:hypothetical protein IPP75_00375 [Candidatus Saccharibacteria bacterium]|nr:MAG: hypothetical protein IPP75_00375 [Candidatus Saccharibacteria bacterium]